MCYYVYLDTLIFFCTIHANYACFAFKCTAKHIFKGKSEVLHLYDRPDNGHTTDRIEKRRKSPAPGGITTNNLSATRRAFYCRATAAALLLILILLWASLGELGHAWVWLGVNIFFLMSVSNKERLTKYSLLHSSSIGPIGPNALQVPNSKPSENEEKNGLRENGFSRLMIIVSDYGFCRAKSSIRFSSY